MTLFELRWLQWKNGQSVELSGLTQDEQIAFHRKAIEALTLALVKPPTMMQISEIPKPDRKISRETIERLKERLKSDDLFTPIILRRNEDGTIQLLDGFHRLVALEELGKTEVPVEFR